ncbi:MAG: hypothetical protein K2N64_02195 [Anaeroplasmataceae bacterium]|nr:hypothetical protein [Anaeroplasmataceae bacterium]
MVIKNTTILTNEESIQEIAAFGRKYYYKKYIFPGILAILGCIAIAVLASQGNGIDVMVVGIAFLILSLFLIGLNTYSVLTVVKKTRKRNPKIEEFGMIHSFTFREESFSLQVKIGDSTTKVEYPYLNLKRIVEYDDYFCFIVGDMDFYTCKKSGFSSPKEVDVFLYGLSKHKIKVKKKLSKTKK